jgi:hypothetical protein
LNKELTEGTERETFSGDKGGNRIRERRKYGRVNRRYADHADEGKAIEQEHAEKTEEPTQKT